jgi:predicted RNA-binding protein with PUA-like domain
MNYWLIKSEPDEFSIDDLAAKPFEPWTGVRNYQARNFMRDQMRLGDTLLFYHSSCKPPGIVGLARVASLPYPDPTQFDLTSEYADPTSPPENPRWILIDVEYGETFPQMITLQELRDDPLLKGMLVTQRGQRLSIQPVTAEHAEHLIRCGRKSN